MLLKEENRTDVLIIGAGPAGTTAARYSAKNADTLVIERKKEIGVPIQCGEFLPQKEELKEMLPKVDFIDEIFSFPEDIISKRTNGINIFSPFGREYEIEFEGMSIHRDKFDKYLADKARNEGAEIITGVNFLGFKDGVAITNKGNIKAKVIIGADGATSYVRKIVGNKVELCPCIEYRYDGEFGDKVEMYFGKCAPGGYAWVIPKKGCANIGLGIQKRYTNASLKNLLKNFVEKLGIEGKPTKKIAGFVPMIKGIERTVSGNLMLVGDAGGHVMASNGGGIPIGMVCGKLAGEVAGKNIRYGLKLATYEEECQALVGELLMKSVKIKRIVNFGFYSDIILAIGMFLLGKKGMRKAITCKPIFTGMLTLFAILLSFGLW
ncbi:MAG: geranylgeranyl reductase family protein [Candidatus Thermoplasmatota archaeon]